MSHPSTSPSSSLEEGEIEVEYSGGEQELYDEEHAMEQSEDEAEHVSESSSSSTEEDEAAVEIAAAANSSNNNAAPRSRSSSSSSSSSSDKDSAKSAHEFDVGPPPALPAAPSPAAAPFFPPLPTFVPAPAVVDIQPPQSVINIVTYTSTTTTVNNVAASDHTFLERKISRKSSSSSSSSSDSSHDGKFKVKVKKDKKHKIKGQKYEDGLNKNYPYIQDPMSMNYPHGYEYDGMNMKYQPEGMEMKYRNEGMNPNKVKIHKHKDAGFVGNPQAMPPPVMVQPQAHPQFQEIVAPREKPKISEKNYNDRPVEPSGCCSWLC